MQLLMNFMVEFPPYTWLHRWKVCPHSEATSCWVGLLELQEIQFCCHSSCCGFELQVFVVEYRDQRCCCDAQIWNESALKHALVNNTCLFLSQNHHPMTQQTFPIT